MKHFRIQSFTTGIALALCLLISVPVEAQTHRRRGSVQTEQSRSNRSGNRNSQSNNRSGRRPGINISGNNHNNNNRANINRKNNSGSKKEQPGYNSRPNNNKPSTGGNYTRPNNSRPKPQPRNHGNHHVHKPKWNGHMTPPARPGRPKYRPMPRIAPPPYWRPHYNAPIINGILGLTFGTLYDATLDYLYNSNYIIDGYTGNAVYLRNVMQLDYLWQDVMLNYRRGKLADAQFVYSTAFYDTGRYNNVYRTLCATYGSPISMRTLGGGGYECAWYGGDSQGLVSLEFYRNGGRYYTTLSFGSRY